MQGAAPGYDEISVLFTKYDLNLKSHFVTAQLPEGYMVSASHLQGMV